MNYLKKCFCVFMFLSVYVFSSGQNAYPKFEMRGVWVASVLNIDYPSVQTMDDNFLRHEWIQLLEKQQALGINTLMVQIRSVGDAFYPSKYVPWSKYLTGNQGTAPYNGYDPLEFMISTAHAYGFEFHAWLNPYRGIKRNESVSSLHPSHQLKLHPDWFVAYDKEYWLNPGLPEVRGHLIDVVSEIVKNYNVDAIHFDDYFYPYKVQGEEFHDEVAFAKYGGQNFANQDDWRRSNVDSMIYLLSRTIKSIKPNVQFGISPFGIWRNAYRDPAGSDTFGGSNYDDLYADVLKWMRNGWIDYVAPQIYWPIGFNKADYQKLVDWWSRNSNGKPVYVGIGAHNLIDGKDSRWKDPNEIPKQIRMARNTGGVNGFIFFSSKSILSNPLGIGDSLRQHYLHFPAFHPQVLAYPEEVPCSAPHILSISVDNGLVKIDWRSNAGKCVATDQYLVYRFDGNAVNFEDSRNIVAIIPANKRDLTFFDRGAEVDHVYSYAITAATRHFKESAPSRFRVIKKYKDGAIERLYWMESVKTVRVCDVGSWF